ncbi:MAG: T9SS type A sorting domain-containing protein, partial [Saprospiraceae bacterium]|nr:T9SS type A sorting domain-containing protein [Saprospiraceae bacterium]
LDIHTIELTIDGGEEATFSLDQNEPNPFDEVTVIGFRLPESGNATLTVYDVSGRVITNVRGNYAQGYNEIKLKKEDLNATGVLYYTLKSGDYNATKKMIIIE